MGKAGKWLKSFLKGKKEKDGEEKVKEKGGGTNQPSTVPTENPTTPITVPSSTPKEKKRWSFRRSANTGTATKDAAKDTTKDSAEANVTTPTPLTPVVQQAMVESEEEEQKKHAMAMAAATAAAADAAVVAAQAAAAVIRLTAAAKERSNAIEEAAAIKIQSVFRSYLARKALCALKGLVKLQALVRGHLVRKQATATLRCMQALVSVQARARAQRIRMADESPPMSERHTAHRRSPQDKHFRQPYNEMDRGMEENIKIVEMDLGEMRGGSKARNSYSHQPQAERVVDHRFSTYYSGHRPPSRHDQISPAQSALTDMSPRAYSGHFEEYSFDTTQSSPQYYSAMSKPDSTRVPFGFPRSEYADSMSQDYSHFPSYMANTESSKAKVRSQSAPKQRPDTYERQPSKRRISMEGRNIPRAVRMQRSSSHVGSAAQGYQYPWSMKLDRSAISLKDSECGSTSTVLTNTNYCRSLVAYESHGTRY